MVVNHTYSLLGVNGALGNQLWQIAGVIGRAQMRGGKAIFPKWDYESFFNIPSNMFVSHPIANAIDYAPDYMQEMDIWYGNENVIPYFRPSQLMWDWMDSVYDIARLYDYTAVHIRRANNLALPDHHPVPSLDYFEKALDLLGAKDIMVFSDDMDWCRKQSIFKDARFAMGVPSDVDVMELTKYAPLNHESAAFDLHTMSMCSKFVISNSTFSWWAAFLSGSKDVVYPQHWYGPALAHIDTSVMFNRLDWKCLNA